MMRFLRLTVSFAIAFLVVGALSVVGINTYFQRPKFSQVIAFRVERADPALLELLRERDSGAPEVPEKTSFEWPERQHDGFVQLQFEVLANGRASNIEVVAAAPAGYYEDQARAEIAARRFLPTRVDGKAVATTRTQIVDFKFTPREK